MSSLRIASQCLYSSETLDVIALYSTYICNQNGIIDIKSFVLLLSCSIILHKQILHEVLFQLTFIILVQENISKQSSNILELV